MAACRQGKRVRFYGAGSRVNEMLVAQKELRLTRMLAQLRKLDVLILDELGFIPISCDGAHLLFQMCSDLYERVSIIVTTNLREARLEYSFWRGEDDRGTLRSIDASSPYVRFCWGILSLSSALTTG
jgi:DNA replication protein DnaC